MTSGKQFHWLMVRGVKDFWHSVVVQRERRSRCSSCFSSSLQPKFSKYRCVGFWSEILSSPPTFKQYQYVQPQDTATGALPSLYGCPVAESVSPRWTVSGGSERVAVVATNAHLIGNFLWQVILAALSPPPPGSRRWKVVIKRTLSLLARSRGADTITTARSTDTPQLRSSCAIDYNSCR